MESTINKYIKLKTEELVHVPLSFYFVTSLNDARNIPALNEHNLLSPIKTLEVESKHHQTKYKKVYPFYKPLRINY